MSLATGEEQRVALHISRSLPWSDFIQGTRFTFMYDGQIHSDVAPVTGGGGVRIDGDDGELLIDITEWSEPSSDVSIILEIGHKDWVLLGITYEERYQLKPQDLIGLKVQVSSTDVSSTILSGEPTPFIYNGYLLTLQYNSSQQSATIKFVNCNPAVDNKCTWYDYDMALGNETLTSYACQNEPLDFDDEIRNFLVDVVGLQPGQIQSVSIVGYSAQVPLPIGAVEV